MSNLIDGGMGLAGEGADGVEDTEEDDDDENIEDLPSVPETDEGSKQAARDDAIDEEGVEESKSPLQPGSNNLLEESKLIDQLALPPEPFRLDELRISAPMLRNELSDSLAFFERTLIESYGQAKFQQALSILERFEREGHDRYTEQSEIQLVRQLE